MSDGIGARPAGAGAVTAIHQFVPALIPRDATGCHTLHLRDALRAAGWRSEIFAEATHDELLGTSIPVERYPELAEHGDVLIYQFSTSSSVAAFLATRTEPLVLHFHNVTDPSLYGGFDLEAARRSAVARDELALLAPRAVLGVADSEYNRADLEVAGCRTTTVAPVLVDFERATIEADSRMASRLSSAKANGGADWLFVGRLVPSKGQHDLIKALWIARRIFDSKARLHLVGGGASGRYVAALRDFARDIGIADAISITGEVSDAALVAHYGVADVYVSASVHEGYGVPLLEAFGASVPVIARAAGAVSDTVADAGIVLDDFSPSLLAAAAHRVAHDPKLRARMISRGHEVLAERTLDRAGTVHVEILSTAFGKPDEAVPASKSARS